MIAAAANLSGLALGPLLGALLAQYAPDPLRLPFLTYLTLLVIVAAGIWGTADTRPRAFDSPYGQAAAADVANLDAPVRSCLYEVFVGGLGFDLVEDSPTRVG